MAITINVSGAAEVPEFKGRKDWTIIAQTDDATGNETLLAGETNKSHNIEQINVVMATGATAVWFRINSNDAAKIGPIDLQYGMIYTHRFIKPIPFTAGEAIKLDTESAQSIHVIMEGYTSENG
jgi:hypothetical protein